METTFEVRDLRQKEKYVTDDTFLNGYARFLGIYAVGVYNSLCRHANKMQRCWPSIDKICEELDIGRNSAIEAVKRLEFFQIIGKTRVGKTANNRYDLYDKTNWKPLTEVCLKDYSEVCLINFTSLRGKLQRFVGQTSNSKETHSKETHSKDSAISENRGLDSEEPLKAVSDPEVMTPAQLYAYEAKHGSRYSTRKTEAPSADIVAVLDLFAPVNPAYLSLRVMMPQREAADRLLKIMEYKAIQNLVAFIVKNRAEQFMPTITTPVALEKKMGDLAVYYQKQNNKAPAFI